MIAERNLLAEQKSGRQQNLLQTKNRTLDRKKALRLSLRSRKRPLTGIWPVS